MSGNSAATWKTVSTLEWKKASSSLTVPSHGFHKLNLNVSSVAACRSRRPQRSPKGLALFWAKQQRWWTSGQQQAPLCQHTAQD